MSWICPSCETVNDDSASICSYEDPDFTCGEPQPEPERILEPPDDHLPAGVPMLDAHEERQLARRGADEMGPV